MPFFSRFKNKGAQPATRVGVPSENGVRHKPRYQSTWNSETVIPEEVQELIHACTQEMKLRAEALDAPFLLLPFRPDSDTSGARLFVRNFFKSNAEGSQQYRGPGLQQEMRLTESLVLCSIIKWCWSRMPGGVVTWPVYEGFQIGEREANMARHAFDTFIPIGVESEARKSIIFDFFDVLSAVAARGKMNGFGGRKLSRLAGWWAFDHTDGGKGFEGGYRSWIHAADATSHLFFAYLRSQTPEADPTMSVIERIPRSLQALLASTEYPPETPVLLQRSTPRLLMLVDTVSPTPFALIRRAKNFEYRDNDRVLREYAEFEDPIDALSEESRRVLYAVSSTNSAAARSRHRTLVKVDESWSAFQNTGFADLDEKALPQMANGSSAASIKPTPSLRSEPRSRNADYARPTTPSWADFLSSGFEEGDATNKPPPLVLPREEILPPIGGHAPTSHVDSGENLAPGELAAITTVELDDAFWWVWMTSLAGEEPATRKAVFGRCALIETTIMQGKWLIMEEQVKGATTDLTDGVFLVPKRSFFGTLTKRGKLGRKRSSYKERMQPPPVQELERAPSATPSKASLAPAQHSKIKQAAAALARKQDGTETEPTARARTEEGVASKTNSMLAMGLQSEAGPAMKWTSAYDKNAIRAQYLGDAYAGTGLTREDILLRKASSSMLGEDAPTPTAATFPEDASAVDLTKTANADPLMDEPSSPPPVESQELQSNPVPMSAFDKETGVSDSSLARKPLPSKDSHPALRNQSIDTSRSVPCPTTPEQSPAALAAQRAMQAIAAAQVPAQAQPKKPESAPGIKKLFTRRKEARQLSNGAVNGFEDFPVSGDSTRRLSIRRKKPGQAGSPYVAVASGHRSSADHEAPQPVMPDSHNQFDNNASLPAENNEAEREFSRFDQGLVPELPGDTPQHSTDHLPDEHHEPSYELPAGPTSPELPISHPVVPTEDVGLDADVEDDVHENDDVQSEATADRRPPGTAESDRWAAIRESAARRAARDSEEQSNHSRPSQSARTDDGETSGEETIESRVARIKARVAELTGNMDSSSTRR